MKRIIYRIANFLGGLNTRDSAYQLKSNELSETYNVRIKEIGNIESRKGYSVVGNQIESGKYVTTIYQHGDFWGNKSEWAICGDKLYKWSGTAWTEKVDIVGGSLTLTLNRRASMFTWKNRLFISNGEEPAFEYGEESLYSQNIIYIADQNNYRVQSFTYSGSYVTTFGSSLEFSNNIRLAVDTINNYIYILDRDTYYIKQYDLNGNFQRKWKKWEYPNVNNARPLDIACGGGYFYVLEIKDDPTIQTAVRAFDSTGEEDTSKLTSLRSVKVDTTARLAVDITNSKVYASHPSYHQIVYNTIGNSLIGSYFGSAGTGNGEFNFPLGIYIDETNSKIYVVDSGNDRIQYFDLSYNYLGQWSVTNPLDIVVSPTYNYVFVTSSDNKILRYDLSGGSGTTLVDASGDGEGQLNNPIAIDIAEGKDVKANVFHTLGTPLSLKASTGTGTGKTGTYKYKLTYATSSLESSGGLESNEVTVSNQNIELTNIPVPSTNFMTGLKEDITRILIYRAKKSGDTWSEFKYIDDIEKDSDGNFSTTYTDDVADGSEGDVIPTTNNLVPTFKYLVQFKDILWGAGDYNNPSYLYWTNSLDQNDWSLEYYTPIGANEKTIITGLKPLGDYLIIFKEDSIWYAIPTITDDLISVTTHLITREFGCVSGFTADYATIQGRQGLIFADKDKGICFLTGNVVIQLSEKIKDDWSSLDKTLLMNAYGKYFEETGEYWLAVTESGSTNNQVWIYNVKTNTLYKPYDLAICSFGKVTKDGIEYLYAGDFDGYVYKLNNTDADNGNAITKYFTTAWLDLGYPTEHKVFDEVIIEYIGKGNWDIDIYWAVDGADFSDSNKFSITISGSTKNRYVKKLPNVKGRVIRFKIKNAGTVTSDPFEICSIAIKARVYKTVFREDTTNYIP